MHFRSYPIHPQAPILDVGREDRYKRAINTPYPHNPHNAIHTRGYASEGACFKTFEVGPYWPSGTHLKTSFPASDSRPPISRRCKDTRAALPVRKRNELFGIPPPETLDTPTTTFFHSLTRRQWRRQPPDQSAAQHGSPSSAPPAPFPRGNPSPRPRPRLHDGSPPRPRPPKPRPPPPAAPRTSTQRLRRRPR